MISSENPLAFPGAQGEEGRGNQTRAVCTNGDTVWINHSPGMTLRDYFAAKALQMIVINDVSGRPDNFREQYSAGAYKWADAMLAERNK